MENFIPILHIFLRPRKDSLAQSQASLILYGANSFSNTEDLLCKSWNTAIFKNKTEEQKNPNISS